MRTDMRPQRGPSGRGPDIWLRGPVPLPDDPPSPPPPPPGTPRRFAWIGLHGGAGVTTLATVYGGRDCGRDWPGPDDPRSVLLVARTHASGLAAVPGALDLFRRGATPPGLDLEGVVLVADAPGRLPRPLAERIRVIESVIDVYRVPWMPDWRLGVPGGPHGARPPRQPEALARLTGHGR
ncbi:MULTISPECIES: DUF6668 family protein [unclassified Streptomyces]|uniref:DUF6668 family protein n=1 Tax=unclassified Streptomyces TaxID=2593676 RepID=UPI0007468CD8|nr:MULTISPECIES: DUF6668 family protein [unclassified Streptomyces]KUL80461.1 hypothetical protein ADL34_00610 [Streptomyces sp. NRRL WC-3605]KUL81118.1 hypothetical protein ADL33_01470 [Streptomyces sp. NRRL WC-3604]